MKKETFKKKKKSIPWGTRDSKLGEYIENKESVIKRR